MIRRRRVQEAAERLREDPSVTVSTIALELGYADQAHFATDFKAVVGVTPSEYRAEAADRP
jgi:AraC-like DNA-binding protein